MERNGDERVENARAEDEREGVEKRGGVVLFRQKAVSLLKQTL